MANLNKVVYLSEAQKNTLFTTGTVTSGQTTITYNENDLYITPQTYDSTPTSGSGNLITSGGVYNALSDYASTSSLNDYVLKTNTSGSETYYIHPNVQAIGYDNTSDKIYSYFQMNDIFNVFQRDLEYDDYGNSGQMAIINMVDSPSEEIINIESRVYNYDTEITTFSNIEVQSDAIGILSKDITINATYQDDTSHIMIGSQNIEISNTASGLSTIIKNLANPTSNYDAAHKKYVDDKVATAADTKNTAGSTDTSSKIYLIGATSQAANPQTYSDNQVYATNGQLDANVIRIAEQVSLQYNSTTQALDFVFA